MDQRQIQQLIPIVLVFLAPLLAKYGITSDQASNWLGATVTYIFTYGIPAASAAYSIIINMKAARIKAAAQTDGVAGVVMATQQAADGITGKGAPTPSHDNIVGPAEVPALAARTPGVAAVVMTSEAAAAAVPASNVVGPTALKPGAT